MFERLRSDPFGSLLIFCLLMGFWFLISGSIDWQHAVTGAFFALLLTLLWNQLMFEDMAPTNFSLGQLFQFFIYLFCLVYEVIKANFNVAYIVMHPDLPISPGLISFKVTLKRDLARVVFANSITLTPGTITVDLQGDRILVHAFTLETARGVEKWYLYKIMERIEEGEGKKVQQRREEVTAKGENSSG